MKRLFSVIFILFFMISLFGCKCKFTQERPLGVWWRDDSLGVNKYLEFAADNGVNEVYYCDDDFDEDTSVFIKKANEKGIRVYFLTGEYEWIDNPSNLHLKINKYIEYQNNYPNKFFGIHLDMKLAENPFFYSDRAVVIEKFIGFASDLKNSFSSIYFDYDLPLVLDDIVSFNGEKKEAYKFMIDIADRVFLFSGRDSADKIYRVSKEVVEYSKKNNKILVLGLETNGDNGDDSSFQEEGKDFMYNEIISLWSMIPSGFGVSINQIKTWYEMRE